MSAPASAIVVGAGVAGLAAACRLAHKGYTTTLLEANSYPGGKLSEFVLSSPTGSYRFDAGPSLFTLPHYLERLFADCGQSLSDYLQLHRLDPMFHYFWPDGTRLDVDASPEAFARECTRQFGVPTADVLYHLRRAHEIHEITHHVFLDRSLHRLATYLRWPTLLSILRLPRIDGTRSLHSANAARLRHPKLVQLFDRYATYNGSDPYRAPATLSLIPHVEFGYGAWFPHGGMHAITLALVRLAEKLGVSIRYDTPVSRILHQNGHITGVETPAGALHAQVVVSNMDVTPTYRRLLPDVPAPERLLAQEKSTSGLIFYWGIRKTFPQLGLHNVFFSSDYQREFDDMFLRQTVPAEPTVYLNISSKMAPADAPEGCENWFVMINTPPDTGQDWPALIATARQAILKQLSARLGTDIEPLIACETMLEPRLIQQRTSSLGGSLYGNASNSRFAAFLRHSNHSGRLKGLYFAGGSVHPGGGIPLCLQSAAIAVNGIPNP